ncbi:MAG: DNA-3-methyladenine glycosylase 2 family protein [Alphaproteobacteria bacterium]|nr:MAG: DNA-3-methyladenine glycosylase 2 family protein [Alphaproteobacteria bacterium]
MKLDPDHCYEVMKARDARFDGVFFVGVSTTGIYCRPICTVRLPGRDRCTFYQNAASAEQAGYRPCMRCRPEIAPGAASVDAVRRLASLAAARIEDGALDDEGSVEDLAAEFGVSSRQIRRAIEREYGVSPVAIAQTRRLLMAKQLLTDTDLKVVDVAFASGFSSLRQFNRLFRDRYRLAPQDLRKNRKPGDANTGLTLRLGYRPPLAWQQLVGFLTSRGTASIDQLDGDTYRRTVRLGDHLGWIAARPVPGRSMLSVDVSPSLTPVLGELLRRLRRLFDLDANPQVIDSCLAADPRLAPLVAALPGHRVPGTLDGFELALRAILGQQVRVKAATTLFGRFVNSFGKPVDTPFDGLDRVAPTAADLAATDLQHLIDQGLTQRRAETVKTLATAVANGTILLEPTSDPARVRAQLLALPGIGPWTADYIAMRAFGDPDAFPHADLGLLKALDAQKPADMQAKAESWRPWRAYGAIRLWSSLGSGG